MHSEFHKALINGSESFHLAAAAIYRLEARYFIELAEKEDAEVIRCQKELENAKA